MLVGLVVRLDQDRRALPAGVRDAAVDVRHLEGEVDDAVAVPAVVVQQRAVRRDAAVMTNRAEPLLRTNALWSRFPVSGPE